MSTCEIAAGSKIVWNAFEEEIKKRKIKDVYLTRKGCVGRCHLEPTVEVYQAGKAPFKYENVDEAKARKIIHDHLIKNNVPCPSTKTNFKEMSRDILTDKSKFIFGDISYFKKQKRMALRNCGVIDPENIHDYLAIRGGEALAKVLTEYTPERVIDDIIKSGLRGRGGGGFPTGIKWRYVAEQNNPKKYLICNADEGDPGAFMDRSIIEGDPFSVLEAMAIGGYAIGSSHGIIYIRAEYPLAVERLNIAIKQAKEHHLLGHRILGTSFSFDITLVLGAGAFVCGEETALIHSIQGERGMPRNKPPYPAVKGLWDAPTLINNVETWANIPVIILDSYESFASIGTEKSKGTKVFALAGKVNNTGLVEVPMGTTLGEVIFDIGGGIKNGLKFKAAQTGGPSGGCLPSQFLNTPIDYDSLISAGSIMGSGGLIVMDEKDCMVDVAKYFLDFTQDESCGKCTPCREGTKRMLEILNRITTGHGKMEDLDKLQKLGETIQKTALCGLGQTAAKPVLSTLKFFRDEYLAHILEKRCPAAVCGELFVSSCQHTCPVNIDIPGFIGLIHEKKYKESLELILERNPFPSVCGRVCHHPCESNCRRGKMDESVSIMSLKRFAADAYESRHVKLASYKGKLCKEKVAVIGSGPAGLSCAWQLAKRGYQVTVFEKQSVPGGMLTLGIPEYRLPKKIVKKEIQRILDTGVVIKTNTALGKNLSIPQLQKQEFKAIYLAVGAWKDSPLNVPVSGSPTVMGALEFLRNYNLHGLKNIPIKGKKIAVIGGGNAAMDVARTSLRLGAKEVHVIYRRTREAMPAISEEVEEAEKEGIQFHFMMIPSEIKNNSLSYQLECILAKEGEFDLSGRRKPVASEEKKSIDADIFISAIGAKPDLPDEIKQGIDFSNPGSCKVNPLTLETSIPWIFAGGDVVRGGGTVIEAIADGEKGAVSIDLYLQGMPLDENRFVIKSERKKVAYFDPSAPVEKRGRPEKSTLRMKKRRTCFKEVELGLSEKEAIREASRCLRCDRKE
ncbi:MAG: FAD-dependent oxidoreductase [Candidatus Aureabacteria bacterium]|nr:FAD-dependent oxidoreductase [Candidatus Auribacterota bacterium]